MGKIGKAASIFVLSSILAGIFGYVVQFFLGYHFGIGKITDAYFMAQSLPFIFTKLLLTGQLQNVFLPFFTAYLMAKDYEGGYKLANNLLSTTFIFFSLIVVILIYFSPAIVDILARGFDRETKILTIKLSRILLPTLLTLGLSGILSSILYAYNEFTIPALTNLISPVFMLLSLIIFGLKGELGILNLARANLLGSFVVLSLLCLAAFNKGMPFRLYLNLKDAEMRKVFKLTSPFLLRTIFLQGFITTNRFISSFLPPGSFTALSYADKIRTSLRSLFLPALSAVCYPEIAKKAIANKISAVRSSISKYAKMANFFIFPLSIGVIFFGGIGVRFLFEKGNFDKVATQMTSMALRILVASFLIEGFMALFLKSLYAFHKTKKIVLGIITSALIATALNFLLGWFFGYIGLAVTMLISNLILVSFYYSAISKKIPGMKSEVFNTTHLKILFGSLFSGLVGLAVLLLTDGVFDLTIKTNQLFQLILVISTFVIVYLIWMSILKVKEWQDLKNFIFDALKNLPRKYILER